MSFRFADREIDTASARSSLQDGAAGGFVAFEGWVRDHNEGQAVWRLEYEAFQALAVKEGERIIAEALARFPIRHALCIHRVGDLRIGEMAVWVGVSAVHRGEAFEACRYIIDAVKHRVPIWKKEYYVNGDSGWVNCERCAAPGADSTPHGHAGHTHGLFHAMQPDYSRQQLLKEVGPDGQARLGASRVLVVGAGGLGCPVLQYLAGAGVGTLGIVDHDTLDPSNLHRQPLYALADVGQPKVALAARSLRALNPAVAVEPYHERLTAANALALVSRYDLVVDCSDNFRTKFLVNDAAVLAGRSAVFASVYQYEGQLQVYRPQADHACLRCIWPDAVQDGVVGNCAEAGVLGPVPGVLGNLQALLVLKILLGLDGQLAGELLLLDLANLTTLRVKTPRCPDCRAPGCARIRTLGADEAQWQVSFRSLAAVRAAGYEPIDIRNGDEVAARPSGARHVPMPELLANPAPVATGGPFVLVCASGKRSLAAAQALGAKGIAVKSLLGGIGALDSDR